MFETLNLSICCRGDEFIRTSAEVLTGNRNEGDRKVYGDGLVWPAGHSFTVNDTLKRPVCSTNTIQHSLSVSAGNIWMTFHICITERDAERWKLQQLREKDGRKFNLRSAAERIRPQLNQRSEVNEPQKTWPSI